MNDDDDNDLNDHDNNFVSGPYVPVMIELALRYYMLFDFPFYLLKQNGNFVKISHDTKSLPKTFEHYRSHGETEIYLDEEDYRQLLLRISDALNKKVSPQNDIHEIAQMYNSVRQQLVKIGLNSFSLMLAEEVNRACLAKIANVPSLSKLINTYRKQCPNEFFKYLTMSFIGSIVVDSFPWSSPQIKQKIALAAFFCDISLDENDYQDSMQWEALYAQGKLPLKIINHPLESAKILLAADTSIPSEVILMIEMHHENAEGTGFPGRISHSNIPLLPTIFIILRQYTDHMIDQLNRTGKFEGEKLLDDFYKQYTQGMFRQAMLGFFRSFSSRL